MTYDVAIAGLGGIGSAIAAHCATRGASVIGLEQFGPAHDRGSSHGQSRMIRQAYFEDAAYVPLVLRSYELWRELEAQTVWRCAPSSCRRNSMCRLDILCRRVRQTQSSSR